MRKIWLAVCLVVLTMGLAFAKTNPATAEAPTKLTEKVEISIAQPYTPSAIDVAQWYPIAAPVDSPNRIVHATAYDPVNDKIYMFGGNAQGTAQTYQNLNQQYDPQTNTWTNKAPMSIARGWMSASYVRGKIYVIGGLINAATSTPTNLNEAYDPTSDAWTTKAPRPIARGCQLQAVWRDSFIYVMGGWDGVSGSQTTQVDIYDPFNDLWLSGTPLPQSADMGGAVIVGDTIYITNAVLRGATSTCWTNLYKGYINPANPTQITWIAGPAHNPPTSIAGAAALGNKVYWLGGFENLTTGSNKLWVYDIATGLISTETQYLYTIARINYLVARPSQNELYVLGGDANCDWNRPNNFYYRYKEYTNDVGVDAIVSPGTGHLVNTQMIPAARIKNFGTASQSFTVRCSIINASGTVRYVNDASVTSLAGGDTITKTFGTWTPTVTENLTVYVTTYLAGDEYNGNDQQTQACEVGSYIIIGTGTTSSPYQPVYRYWNYSTHEVIYLQSEINVAGIITDIAWNKASGTDVNPIENVTIYMKEDATATMTSGDYSLTGYTQVYSGTFPNNAQSGWMNITLDTPFAFNNINNLHILVLKGYQYWISNYPYYYYTTTATNMARYGYSDDYQPTSLTATTMRPNVRLNITPFSNNDVGVMSIVTPLASHVANTSMTPSAIIKNYGLLAQSNIPVYCQIVGPGSVVRYSDATTISSLAAGAQTTVNFTSWVPTIVEEETVKIWTALTGDENPANDLKTKVTNVYILTDAAVTAISRPYASKETEKKRVEFTPQVTVTNNGSFSADIPVIAEIYSLALNEGFESTTFPPAGWDTSWIRGTSTYNYWCLAPNVSSYPTNVTPHSGEHMAEYNSFSASTGNAYRLRTPWINLAGDNVLSFWMFHDDGFLTSYDSIMVMITTNGTDYTELATYTRPDPSGDYWDEKVIPLTGYSGNVRIAFDAYSRYGNDMFIDDVKVSKQVYRDSTNVTVSNGSSAETYFTPWTPITEGTYLFKAYTTLAGDMVPENDEMTRMFSVTPITLTLVEPGNETTIGDNTPTLVWNKVPGATAYQVQLWDIVSDISIDTTVSDSCVEITTNLPDNTYYWKARVVEPTPEDPWSDIWSFTIATVAPGWTQKEAIPEGEIKPGKMTKVKDGGSMVAVGTDVYVLVGGKSDAFYKYSEGVWDTLMKIPFSLKYKPGTPLDSAKWNNKKVGKG
ncbi:MAG: hypothetical protein ABIK31_05790, partial [candidate division WOR-3 bacterium]